jgi:hypothetical protein
MSDEPPSRSPPHSKVNPFLVLAIVAAVAVASFFFVFVVENPVTEICHGCPASAPLGTNMAVGNATELACAPGNTFVATGCMSGHTRGNVDVVGSAVTFGDIAFAIINASGTVFASGNGLGFTVLSASGQVLTQFQARDGYLSMNSSSWTYENGSVSSTPILTSDLIVVDFGTMPVRGLILEVRAVGVGFSGTVQSNPFVILP